MAQKHFSRFNNSTIQVQHKCVLTVREDEAPWTDHSFWNHRLPRYISFMTSCWCCTWSSAVAHSHQYSLEVHCSRKQNVQPLMWSQGLQPHKASPMGWSFLFRISHHAAAGGSFGSDSGVSPRWTWPSVQPARFNFYQLSQHTTVSGCPFAFSAVFPPSLLKPLLTCETPVKQVSMTQGYSEQF